MELRKANLIEALKEVVFKTEIIQKGVQPYAWQWFQSDECVCKNKQEIFKYLKEAGLKPARMRKIVSHRSSDNGRSVDFISHIEFIDDWGNSVCFLNEFSGDFGVDVAKTQYYMRLNKSRSNKINAVVSEDYEFVIIDLHCDNPLGSDWNDPKFNMFVENTCDGCTKVPLN